MARIAVLIDDDFEDSEYRVPVERLREAGHDTVVAGARAGVEHQGKRGDERVSTEQASADLDPGDFDAVVIPGGHAPDKLRMDTGSVRFVASMNEADKPVAAVCHAGSLLIDAGVVAGRRLTSWPSIRTDLTNAGAEWVDQEVVEDGNLITSRRPDDLEAFSAAILNRLRSTTSDTPS
jgi:protease I